LGSLKNISFVLNSSSSSILTGIGSSIFSSGFLTSSFGISTLFLENSGFSELPSSLEILVQSIFFERISSAFSFDKISLVKQMLLSSMNSALNLG